jgi:hypothetical protein
VEQPNTSFADLGGVLFNSTLTTLIVWPAGQSGDYVIPASVTALADAAFEDCAQLVSVTIPTAVNGIGMATFRNCPSLISIEVSPSNSLYSSTDGVLFNKDKTLLLQYPCGKQGPAAVPASLTRLGPSDAFFGCSGVTGFTVDPASTIFSTLDGVLFSKDGSVLVRFPPGRAGAYEIPNGVTTMDGYAFSSCAGLTRVTAPATVATFGYASLASCGGLTGVYCEGNRPDFSGSVFSDSNPNVVVYYLPGTTGWGSTVADSPPVPAVLWQPQADLFTRTNGRFGFTVQGHPGSILVVEMSADLSAGKWIPVTSLTIDSTGIALFEDPEAIGSSSRLYRFRWP